MPSRHRSFLSGPILIGAFGFLVVVPILHSFPRAAADFLFKWVIDFAYPGLFLSLLLGGALTGNVWIAAVINGVLYFAVAAIAFKAWSRWRTVKPNIKSNTGNQN